MDYKKSIILLSSIFLIHTITGCSAGESESSDSENFIGNSYSTINDFLNDETLCGQDIDCLTSYDAPSIEGNYDQTASIFYSDFPNEEGLTINDGFIFRDQKYGEISILEYNSYIDFKGAGDGLFLRGAGNQFTTYQSTAGEIEGSDCLQYGALVAAGAKSSADGDIDSWEGIWKLTGGEGADCRAMGLEDYIGGYKKFSGTLTWKDSNTADPF